MQISSEFKMPVNMTRGSSSVMWIVNVSYNSSLFDNWLFNVGSLNENQLNIPNLVLSPGMLPVSTIFLLTLSFSFFLIL